MSISQVSNVNPVYQPTAQSQASGAAGKSTSQPSDSVQISQAAYAQLQSGDVDHDGDSH
jgi:hypothetical protein